MMRAKGGRDDRPRLLDLGSCAGVGADGYVRAGFKVTCVDNDPRALEWCPWDKRCADVLDVLADEDWVRSQFDAIHGSMPCQGFTAARELAKAQGKGDGAKTLDLLTPVLDILKTKYSDMPWVMENVPRSPLAGHRNKIVLCGSMFGLQVQRHRLFASNMELTPPGPCDHATFEADPVTGKPRPWGVYYIMGDNIPKGGRTVRNEAHAMEVMGVGRKVPWEFLKEGLPPAYTHHVGQQIIRVIR